MTQIDNLYFVIKSSDEKTGDRVLLLPPPPPRRQEVEKDTIEAEVEIDIDTANAKTVTFHSNHQLFQFIFPVLIHLY